MRLRQQVHFMIAEGQGLQGGRPARVLFFAGDGQLDGDGVLIVFIAEELGVDEAGMVDLGGFGLLGGLAG